MKIEVLGREITVAVWDGTQAPISEPVLGIDTETEAIVKGKPVVPAILQVYYPQARHVDIVHARDFDAFLGPLLDANADAELRFHNFPFDFEVLGGRQGPLMDFLLRRRIADVGLMYSLHCMREGTFVGAWGLDDVVRDLLKATISKDKEIRLSFHPGMELTDRHTQYAATDPVVTVMCGDKMPNKEELKTYEICLRGHVALSSYGVRGMLVDLQEFDKLKTHYDGLVEEERKILNVFGLYPGEDGVQGVLQKLMLNIEQRTNVRFPRTANKKDEDGEPMVSITDDLIDSLGDNPHPFIIAYRTYKHDEKMANTYLNRELIGVDGRVHPFYNPIVKTGRTSCSTLGQLAA